jgi:hypothetical protein
MGGHGLDSPGSEQRPVLGCCERGNETLGYIKVLELFELLNSH